MTNDVDMSKTQRPLRSLVPEAEPVVLEDYYDEFEGYYPEAELQTKRWFVRNVEPDWTILDIGANVGVYSVLFGRAAHKGRVHAFEPTSTISKLNANLSANDVANVTTYEIAVGSRSGKTTDRIYRMWGTAPEEHDYAFTTVDEFVSDQGIEKVNLIKIDVDGFDLEALKGARQTLIDQNPYVMIELNHALATRNQSVGEALTWLIGLGYRRAEIYDEENYLLKRSEGETSTSPAIDLVFDTEPLLLPLQYQPGAALDGQLADEPYVQDTTAVSQTEAGTKYTLSGPRWQYGVSWDLAVQGPELPMIVALDVTVTGGVAGIGAVANDGSNYVGQEVAVEPVAVPQTIEILVPDASAAKMIMVRNVDPQHADADVIVHSITCYEAEYAADAVKPLLRRDTRSFDVCEAAGISSEEAAPIEIIPVDKLGAAMNWSAPYMPPQLVIRHELKDFNTERDETELYRYIYSQFRPSRHLELGTWYGYGTTTVAESSDAEIWTINLPEGETDDAGAAVYSSGDGASDSGDRIGWRYREAGYADRVHQLLLDSATLDTSQFGAGFFDTALVDGGHTAKVMAADTDKALEVVRSGGLIIWHDFCPEPGAVANAESVKGVIEGWAKNYHRWRPELDRLFWIRPSWLLVGIRK
ncbi:MAG: hypothetical protein Rhirs2KO_19010 [Rhizobiaceae bacterium]